MRISPIDLAPIEMVAEEDIRGKARRLIQTLKTRHVLARVCAHYEWPETYDWLRVHVLTHAVDPDALSAAARPLRLCTSQYCTDCEVAGERGDD